MDMPNRITNSQVKASTGVVRAGESWSDAELIGFAGLRDEFQPKGIDPNYEPLLRMNPGIQRHVSREEFEALQAEVQALDARLREVGELFRQAAKDIRDLEG